MLRKRPGEKPQSLQALRAFGTLGTLGTVFAGGAPVSQRAPLFQHIAELHRELAAAYDKAASIEATDQGEEFTSLALPSGVSRRAFRDTCASGRVLGAHRDGKVWRCSKSAWLAARTKAPAKRPTAPATNPDEAIAERALAAALRPTKGPRAA
jgi:hypothetical protein